MLVVPAIVQQALGDLDVSQMQGVLNSNHPGLGPVRTTGGHNRRTQRIRFCGEGHWRKGIFRHTGCNLIGKSHFKIDALQQCLGCKVCTPHTNCIAVALRCNPVCDNPCNFGRIEFPWPCVAARDPAGDVGVHTGTADVFSNLVNHQDIQFIKMQPWQQLLGQRQIFRFPL